MNEPPTPPSLTFEDLKTLAWARVPRSDRTDALYALEEGAKDAIDRAASELRRLFNAADLPVTTTDARALELVTILERYGGAGVLAARIVVDRYGFNTP